MNSKIKTSPRRKYKDKLKFQGSEDCNYLKLVGSHVVVASVSRLFVCFCLLNDFKDIGTSMTVST